ncbi:unnamed protein product [Didymodactylos carnosus]|uniref:Uncharacterized protein n=1 Tax=Didymodactylos carnosus TaxID=1234261 RepID=A0A8S2UT62_9BILA|nr:unnamed protein product [Didymodactylos carnosus]CAF4353700.1 unnamed protein product [Didymodactylos carnosus]
MESDTTSESFKIIILLGFDFEQNTLGYSDKDHQMESMAVTCVETLLTNLSNVVHLNYPISCEIMCMKFLEYILNDDKNSLDELLNQALENFVDQFVLLLISLIQQQQQDRIKLLKENNQITSKSRSLDDIVLLETLDLSNLIRHFDTNYDNQKEIEE